MTLVQFATDAACARHIDTDAMILKVQFRDCTVEHLPQTGYPVKAGKPAVLDVVILTDENSEFGTDGMRDPPNGVRFTE